MSCRVLRGGCCYYDSQYLRSARRASFASGLCYDDNGFRLVRERKQEISSLRVLRGGSWYYYVRGCRSAYRGNWGAGDRGDGVGLRLVREKR